VRRLALTRAALLALLCAGAAAAAVIAPGSVSALQVTLVGAAAVLGAAATLLAQLALGLQRTVAWSLRYPLENGVVVVGVLALYPRHGIDGAFAAIALGAGPALALGLATARPQLRGARAGGPLAPGVAATVAGTWGVLRRRRAGVPSA
jgi:hypothetical protein